MSGVIKSFLMHLYLQLTKRVSRCSSREISTGERDLFFDTQLHFDGLLWNGPGEIHLKSSDWYRHGHHLDENYQNIILHIVWEHDVDISYPSGKKIPTIQVKDYLDPKT